MLKPSPPPKTKVDEAERKIGAVLEDLEQETASEVKDIDLEDVVDDDPTTGLPTVHEAVDIDVEPRPRRKWLK